MKLLNLLLSARNRKIRPRSPLVIVFILTAFILAAASPALALSLHLPGPAVEWESTAEKQLSSNYTFGFSFRTNIDLWVTHLGVYDGDSDNVTGGGDGLLTEHKVGLWNWDGSDEIARTTVPDGDTAELDGHFRYVEIDPFILNRGSYVVGAYWPGAGDPYAGNPYHFAKNQHVIWQGGAYIESDNLLFPEMILSKVEGYFGGNLKLSLEKPSPVPEPQTML